MCRDIEAIISKSKRDPVLNSHILNILSFRQGSHPAESWFYIYGLTAGNIETIGGGKFYVVPMDISKFCAESGLQKSVIYESIRKLCYFGVLEKILIRVEGINKKYLFITNNIHSERVIEYRSNLEVGEVTDNSTPVEKVIPKPVSSRAENRNNDTPVSAPFSTETENEDSILPYEEYDSIPSILNTDRNTITDSKTITASNTTTGSNVHSDHRNLPVEAMDVREKRVQEIERMILKLRQTKTKDSQSMIRDLGKEKIELEKKLTVNAKGYFAKDYAPGGFREITTTTSTSPKHEFIRHYMANVFTYRQINYYIPKSNIPKYYKRALDVIDRFGGIAKALKYIDWYIRSDRFKRLGYSLDALVSHAVMNQFFAADPRDTREGLATGFIDSVEGAKERAKKGIIV